MWKMLMYHFVGAFSKTRLLHYSTMLAIAAFAAGCRSYEKHSRQDAAPTKIIK
jgi:hypothetical protein